MKVLRRLIKLMTGLALTVFMGTAKAEEGINLTIQDITCSAESSWCAIRVDRNFSCPGRTGSDLAFDAATVHGKNVLSLATLAFATGKKVHIATPGTCFGMSPWSPMLGWLKVSR